MPHPDPLPAPIGSAPRGRGTRYRRAVRKMAFAAAIAALAALCWAKLSGRAINAPMMIATWPARLAVLLGTGLMALLFLRNRPRADAGASSRTTDNE